VTDVTDSAQEIAFAGHTNHHARPLFPDALARLLAPGNDCHLDAARARQGSRLVELLLAQATR
jgi:hypothetical protein